MRMIRPRIQKQKRPYLSHRDTPSSYLVHRRNRGWSWFVQAATIGGQRCELITFLWFMVLSGALSYKFESVLYKKKEPPFPLSKGLGVFL